VCCAVLTTWWVINGPPGAAAAPPSAQRVEAPSSVDARVLAQAVTITRDRYGVPHIDGVDDAAVMFGFAYAQCEDYFWQVEDTFLLALGRYSEVYGPKGLNSDLLNRAFEVTRTAQEDYERLGPDVQRLCEACAAGFNYYLETHPETRPRLITRFEPWHLLAYGRQLTLELGFRYTRLSHNFMPRSNEPIDAGASSARAARLAVGSNAWAIAPRRTRDGHALLLANPHQPWYGFGQFYEAHLRSGEGWNFSGATFFGSPLPTLGHNEHAGWSFTVNEPDIADVWFETFDDPHRPLHYRYGDGYREAIEWRDTIRVKTHKGYKDKPCTFRKTHHGPIVAHDDQGRPLAARIARLYDAFLMHQALDLMRVRNIGDFRRAMGQLNLPIMNAVYADTSGEIYYLYNGAIPRRDPAFEWSLPVDGSDPRTEWRGMHTIDELPQLLSPPCGYVQSCNSSPFTTTDDGSPRLEDFPPYMVEDKHDDKRRAKRSREILNAASELTFEDLRRLAFDTELYWAKHELPGYFADFERLEQAAPERAAPLAPMIRVLRDWDCRITRESAGATLCTAWYEELYGASYPGERLRDKYSDRATHFNALSQAASTLRAMHGDWRVPWGEIHRSQRHADVAELMDVPFDDAQPSLPLVGGHGPMGIVFTQYYTPSIKIPFIRSQPKRYGIVGATYLGVFEFGPRIRGATLLQYGASGDPQSSHFFDQASLLSERRLKPELFYWEDVEAGAVAKYHPGERSAPPGAP
jgi:acyl-homoserine-lactone acylase